MFLMSQMVRPIINFQVASSSNSIHGSQWGKKGDQGKSQAWHTNQQCGYVLEMKEIDWNPTKFTNCQKRFLAK